MIYDMFIKVLELSMITSVLSVIIIIMRGVLRKHIPKGFLIVLWVVMLLKAVTPVELPSTASIYNSINTPFDDVKNTSYNLEEHINVNNNRIQSNGKDIHYTYDYSVEPNNNLEGFARSIQKGNSAMLAAGSIWLTGTFIMLFTLLFIYILCYKKLSSAVPYEDNHITAFIKNHSASNIKIYRSHIVRTPVVFGVFKPRIILPEGFHRQDATIKEHILIHELQHIKRFDSVLNLFALLTLCIHWFNPFLWISYLMLIKDIESYCDERAIRQLGTELRSEYAMSLLNSAMVRYDYTSALTIGFGKASIKERIVNIMDYKKAHTIPTIITIMVVAAVLTVFATDAKPYTNPDDLPIYSAAHEYDPIDHNNDNLTGNIKNVNEMVIHDTYEDLASKDNDKKNINKTTARYLSYNRKATEVTDEDILKLRANMTFEEIFELLGDTQYEEGSQSNSRYLTYSYQGLELHVVDGWSSLDNKSYPQRSGAEILAYLKELLVDKSANSTGTVIILNT